LHDIGKPGTKRFKKGSGWTFHGHEFIGGKMAKTLFQRLSMPLDSRMKYVVKLIQMSSRPIAVITEDVTDGAIRRLLFDAGDDIDDLMQLCEAVITTKNAKKKQRFLKNFNTVRNKIKAVEAKDKLRNWQPPVNGNQLMQWFDLPPGKAIGDLKTAIREGILDGDIANDFDDAKAFAFQWAKNKGYPLKP
jgi:hypothetical protein